MDQMEQTIFGPWRFGDPTPEPATANDKRQTTNDQAQAGAGMESMGPKWQRRIRWVARQLRAWDEVPLAEQLEWIVEDVQDWGMRMCDRYEREIELMRQARAGQEGPRHPAVDSEDSEDSKLQALQTKILEQKVRETRQWLREIYEAATGTAYSDNLCWTEAMPSLVKTVAELKGAADLTKRYHEIKQQYDEQHFNSRRKLGLLRQLYTAAMGQRFPELATWDDEFPRLLARIEELVLSERRATNDQADDEATDVRQTTNDERQTTYDERQTTNDERRTTNDERQTTNDPRSDAQLAFDMGNVPRLKTITTEQYVQAVRMRSEGKPLPAIAWQLDLPLRWFSAIGPMITEHARQRGLLRTEHDLGRWDKVLAGRLDLRRREQ